MPDGFCTIAGMRDDDATLRQQTVSWLEAVTTEKAITPSRLAAEIGYAQSALSRFLTGRNKTISTRILSRIAAATKVQPPALVRAELERAGLDDTVSEVKATLFGDRGIPVWGAHQSAGDDTFKLNPIPLQFLQRPDALSASNRLIAFFMPDDSMSPRWSAGEPVLADMARPAQVNTVALVRLANTRDPNADEVCKLRFYAGRRDGYLLLRRYDDGGDEREPLGRLLELKQVISWSDLLR